MYFSQKEYKGKGHPFFMVAPSAIPIITSLSISALVVNFIYLIWFNTPVMFIFGWVGGLLISIWVGALVFEGGVLGVFTKVVCEMFKLGFFLFILSEVMFFFSFFWSFFHSSLSPSIDIFCWPPINIYLFNPLKIPLLNTIVLLSSGVSVTWAHFMMIKGDKKEALTSLVLTVFLGVFFTFLQYLEYFFCFFNISDSVLGSIFFVSTGFHGIHVLLGTLAIFFVMVRVFLNELDSKNHISFELAIWYWHFVDVVWLFLYIWVYWWCFKF